MASISSTHCTVEIDCVVAATVFDDNDCVVIVIVDSTSSISDVLNISSRKLVPDKVAFSKDVKNYRINSTGGLLKFLFSHQMNENFMSHKHTCCEYSSITGTFFRTNTVQLPILRRWWFT